MITLFLFTNSLVIDLAGYPTMQACRKAEAIIVARYPGKFRTDCIKKAPATRKEPGQILLELGSEALGGEPNGLTLP
jgi:hypothetical protein